MYTVILVACDTAPRTPPPPRPKGPGIDVVDNLELEIFMLSFLPWGFIPRVVEF